MAENPGQLILKANLCRKFACVFPRNFHTVDCSTITFLKSTSAPNIFLEKHEFIDNKTTFL